MNGLVTDIGSHAYGGTLIEEVISKTFKKNQNVRFFNCHE